MDNTKRAQLHTETLRHIEAEFSEKKAALQNIFPEFYQQNKPVVQGLQTIKRGGNHWCRKTHVHVVRELIKKHVKEQPEFASEDIYRWAKMDGIDISGHYDIADYELRYLHQRGEIYYYRKENKLRVYSTVKMHGAIPIRKYRKYERGVKEQVLRAIKENHNGKFSYYDLKKWLKDDGVTLNKQFNLALYRTIYIILKDGVLRRIGKEPSMFEWLGEAK